MRGRKLTPDQVTRIRICGEMRRHYPSMKQLAREMGLHVETIRQVQLGRRYKESPLNPIVGKTA